jgi:uncharacterized protein YciI
MLYSIVGIDVENSLQARLAARPGHVERLKALVSQGKLIVAGPNPAIDSSDPGDAGFTGSIIIAEFDSLQDARDWADADPYIIGGVYDSVEVKPFNQALP